MMTVRFPTGFSIQYNDATFCKHLSNGDRKLYTADPDKGGTWIAIVPADSVIEAVRPCRLYDATHQPAELARAALQAIDARELHPYDLAKIKKSLQGFNALRKRWKS